MHVYLTTFTITCVLLETRLTNLHHINDDMNRDSECYNSYLYHGMEKIDFFQFYTFPPILESYLELNLIKNGKKYNLHYLKLEF